MAPSVHLALVASDNENAQCTLPKAAQLSCLPFPGAFLGSHPHTS